MNIEEKCRQQLLTLISRCILGMEKETTTHVKNKGLIECSGV
jgi:hypothetical protein